MKEIMLAAAAAIGVLLAVQASVNPRLAKAAGSPYGGATLQLWVAVALLVGTAAATSSLGALQRLTDVPGWMLLGGLASPMYITSGILLLPRVGALTAAGLFVAGQVLGSTVIDGFGLLDVPHRPVTIGLVAGSALALIGRGSADPADSKAEEPKTEVQTPAATGHEHHGTGAAPMSTRVMNSAAIGADFLAQASPTALQVASLSMAATDATPRLHDLANRGHTVADMNFEFTLDALIDKAKRLLKHDRAASKPE